MQGCTQGALCGGGGHSIRGWGLESHFQGRPQQITLWEVAGGHCVRGGTSGKGGGDLKETL
jgi:hypothetical protein